MYSVVWNHSLYLPTRDTFYLFTCYFAYHKSQCRNILLRNGKSYPILSSPQIWTGIPVYLISLKLNILNTTNDLNNLVDGLVTQKMPYILRPLRPLRMPLIIYHLVLTYALLRNQQRPILILDIFVGSFNPS